MPGVIRPPWGKPTGPKLKDQDLIASFANGSRTGHSGRYHIEEHTLLEDRFETISIRCETTALLVRTDVDTSRLQRHLARAGLSRQQVDPPLATVVGLQTCGLPAASWDLWGTEPERALDGLRHAAADGLPGPMGGTS